MVEGSSVAAAVVAVAEERLVAVVAYKRVDNAVADTVAAAGIVAAADIVEPAVGNNVDTYEIVAAVLFPFCVRGLGPMDCKQQSP